MCGQITIPKSKCIEQMFEIQTLLILIPLLPLTSAIVTALLGPRVLRGSSHWPTIAAIVGSFVCSVLLATQVRSGASAEADGSIGFERHFTLWEWANVTDALESVVAPAPTGEEGVPQNGQFVATGGPKDFSIGITLRADALTSIMLVMVTFVASLVAIYASGYMHGDGGYWRFFSYVSLFVFSMTMLVSVSNFILLYVFWRPSVFAVIYLSDFGTKRNRRRRLARRRSW